MATSFLGGMPEQIQGPQPWAPEDTPDPQARLWRFPGTPTDLFLYHRGNGFRLFSWGNLCLLVRGYLRSRGSTGPLYLERTAEELRSHYLEHGTLAVEDLEGSFTLALLDGQAGRVVLYRNLVGAGFTYYHPGPDGLLFSSNLADLAAAAGVPLRPNRPALPAFFLFRFVPAHETLLDGFYRLLPGEEVNWNGRGLVRTQRQTFEDLREGSPVRDGAVERLEETMAEILRDCADHRPDAANLLSGGIDSSYIQAAWNRVGVPGDTLPPSFSVCVDHPRTWQDTDYAVTAAQALGTRHALIPADEPYETYLLDTLASTGEPPNHVQTAYFGHLARQMTAQGVTTGLCGEGADSLFGVSLAGRVQQAERLRRLAPLSMFRRLAAFGVGAVGWSGLYEALRLSNHLEDWSWPDHPVNQAAVFTDRDAVRACFGAAAVEEAFGWRRSLADRYGVPDHPIDRLHAAGFLGEAMDSASLWTTLFNQAGADLLCPFLDSRMLRLVVNLAPSARFPFGEPKALLKQALGRHAPAELVRRRKLGFGQPIFEWLGPGGQLRPLVERLGRYDFVDPPTLARSLARPNWFLYSLLCYDLWHKLFIERTLAPRVEATPATLPAMATPP